MYYKFVRKMINRLISEIKTYYLRIDSFIKVPKGLPPNFFFYIEQI